MPHRTSSRTSPIAPGSPAKATGKDVKEGPRSVTFVTFGVTFATVVTFGVTGRMTDRMTGRAPFAAFRADRRRMAIPDRPDRFAPLKPFALPPM